MRASELDEPTRKRLLDRRVHLEGDPADWFGGEDLGWYLERSRGRLATGFELAAGLPGPILELGAEPWFLAQLLLERGQEVTCAGKRGGIWEEDRSHGTPLRVELEWDGRRATIEHHLFDAERERFPFPDGAFASVICMDMLEHLRFSPAHLLYEAGRVLADGGRLLVVTPNALSAPKTAAMLRARNPAWPYSGHGPDGRHNREFSAPELAELLEHANFEAAVETFNVAGYEATEPLGRLLRALARWRPLRRDYLFAVARRCGPPRYGLPESLYRGFDRERMRREGVFVPPD
jgi:SAM-dependent methyltransferase